MASDNKTLGQFTLEGIPPAGRGTPQVEVTFDLNADGILSVKAKDKTTGKEQSIRIEARSSLSKEEIERMKQDAEAHAAEDEKKKEHVEVVNTADTLVYTAEKALKDNGEKITAELKKEVEDKAAEVKKIKEGTDTAAIKAATEQLSSSLSKIGETLQQQASTENAQKDQKDSGPRDANYKEGDDKNAPNS